MMAIQFLFEILKEILRSLIPNFRMKSWKANSSFFLILEKVDILMMRIVFLRNDDMGPIKD
jgi:hypothetical protein